MIALIAALLLNADGITRDNYGVPQIKATTEAKAFQLLGQAVAQDRLWQLELSRRSSLGQLAEVLGPSALPSDQNALSKQYTSAEYEELIKALPTRVKTLWTAYAKGINQTIAERTNDGTLPEGYKSNGFSPRPWTLTDSAAIAVNLARQFGQGGAGELRNYALVQYLRTRPAIKDRLLDVLDDLAWQNEADHLTTIAKADDKTKAPPTIFQFNRQESEKHLAALPPTNLLELAGSVRMASMEDQRLIAESLSLPHKMGSYAIAVHPTKSSTGRAMLLSAPQMGHNSPSIVHEAAIDCPTIKVAGMNVPGIPGILIGNSPTAAWGFTSGVADLEDIFVSPLKDSGTYISQGVEQKLQPVEFTLKVKGEQDRTFTQWRTVHGPVLLKSTGSKAVYSLKSPFWMKEISTAAAMIDLYSAKAPADFDRFASKMPTSFNLFFATAKGEIGHRFCGFMPIRAQGVDPRLPTPDTKENQWRGILKADQMPQVTNPKSGFIINWNNKPIDWWPNGDTPAWGLGFRNKSLFDALPSGNLAPADLERAAMTIAQRDTATLPLFKAHIDQALQLIPTNVAAIRELGNYKGDDLEGSLGASIFKETINQLRRVIFLDDLGNFTADNLFSTVVQNHLIAKALNGQTNLDYLNKESAPVITARAINFATDSLRKSRGESFADWGFIPPAIRYSGQSPVSYNARGTYIQITTFGAKSPTAISVAGPGVAESGPHANSQVPLVRDWKFKPMGGWN
jgi:penicillin amidase